ncbi:uncharacterized protein TRIADDRAFT_53215 [Trichoplax adhaerens]|uniref:3-keto-steroid reductase n=1 Tax=Trichoplax adhaerens TaxID=10228 RepID=B3RNM2_TRIAD|nr:hypothetical protein TRIADDRAFT_53215 [Trichoplax adhaerens]EDV28042.1 hypothetical protein TRIADDRAFT_53215 [Trichoplax adhaerens]|eukprot:XP_002109876.1 hypothetical protein TRIADDRAFT_53215 [Trichoplax adhaerens]
MNHEGDIVLITGATAGIGQELARQLVSEFQDRITICLACRNIKKANATKEMLMSLCSTAKVDILTLVTSDAKSVIAVAEEIKRRYSYLNHLFLNAGIMPITQFDWSHFVSGFRSFSSFINMFTTGEGLIIQNDSVTNDGLQSVFATNLFGHYLLISELEDYLAASNKMTHIVWTSSSAANRASFSLDNMQHVNGKDPYGSSKHAIDLLNVSLNEKLNSKGIYSHVTCPGLVMTNLTYGIMSPNSWYLLYPIIALLRMCVSNLNITAANGCTALLPVESTASNNLREKLDQLIKEVKSKLRE